MLSDFLNGLDWTSILLWLAGILGSGLAALLVWYRRKLKEWKDFWKLVLLGLKTIPELQTKVAKIAKQVTPNGGGAIPDGVKRIEVGLLALQQELHALDEAVFMITATIQANDDADPDQARFDCSDKDGGNTYVSETYARWLKVGTQDLMGWDFLNYVHPEDRARVQALWDSCREQHRRYENVHRMVASDGEVITVSVTLKPVPRLRRAQRWIGCMRRVENAPAEAVG